MRNSFEKIKKVIESCTLLQQIRPCIELLSNFKAIYQVTDEDGAVVMLSDILKQKEEQLYNNFTL
jgi:endonuclease IV